MLVGGVGRGFRALIQQLRVLFLFTILFFHPHWICPQISLPLDHKMSAEVLAITSKQCSEEKRDCFFLCLCLMNKETFHGSSLEYFSTCLIGQDKSPRSASNPIIGGWNGIIIIGLGQIYQRVCWCFR